MDQSRFSELPMLAMESNDKHGMLRTNNYDVVKH